MSLRYALKRNDEAFSHIDIAELLAQAPLQRQPPVLAVAQEAVAESQEPHGGTAGKLISATDVHFETLTSLNQNNKRVEKRTLPERIDLTSSPKKPRIDSAGATNDNSGLPSPVHVANSQQSISPVSATKELVRFGEEASPQSTSIFSGVATTIRTIFGHITNSAKKDTNSRFEEDPSLRTMGTQVAADSLIMLHSKDAQVAASPPPAKSLKYVPNDIAEDDYDMLIRSPEEDYTKFHGSGKGRLRKPSSSRLSIDDDWH